MTEQVSDELKTIAKKYYLDYIGFADLRNYQEELTVYGGGITENYPSGISLGLVIPDSMLNYISGRSKTNIPCEYGVHSYKILNQRLNIITSLISSYLKRQGFHALTIAAEATGDDENVLPTVSHKMIAHIAGLGWIGKSRLLVTPEHGPRLLLISILTDAPLDAVNNPLEQRCSNCTECVKICPVNAIKDINYKDGEESDISFDLIKCRDHFDGLLEKHKFPVCGHCLYVCPYGRTS
jgi:epoxyqueuosine reductase QueG